MNIIEPYTLTNTTLQSSNVTEDDHAEWDISTTYAADDYVIVVGTDHRIYKSVQGSNLGNDPTTDDGTWWVDQGATNRWKAFDQRLSDPVTNTTSIEYQIIDPNRLGAIAFFSLGNANTAQVVLTDETVSPAEEVYNETVSLIDTSYIVDWFTYFFEENRTVTELILDDLPPYAGATLDITITGDTGATVSCGQIAYGKKYEIGDTLMGSGIGIQDFSRKDRDTFGNAILTERAFAQEVSFNVAIVSEQANRVKNILSTLRATPAVYYADSGAGQFGAVSYGFFQDFFIPIQTTKTIMTIEIEGLV